MLRIIVPRFGLSLRRLYERSLSLGERVIVLLSLLVPPRRNMFERLYIDDNHVALAYVMRTTLDPWKHDIHPDVEPHQQTEQMSTCYSRDGAIFSD